MDRELDSQIADDGQPGRDTQPVDQENPPRSSLVIVGIGASAGGLEAVTEFLAGMPSDSGIAFVFVQHLSPHRESLTAELLSRETRMPVVQITDGLRVEPNHFYVIRPGHTLTLQNGALHLSEKLSTPGHGHPIDDFFRSLAAEQRERAICIVMSGMGSNGSAGAQSVRAVGGLCIAQDPETAKYPSMPWNVIEAGADYVLRCNEMPEVLSKYVRHLDQVMAEDVSVILPRDSTPFREVVSILRRRTRLDFSGYKADRLAPHSAPHGD